MYMIAEASNYTHSCKWQTQQQPYNTILQNKNVYPKGTTSKQQTDNLRTKQTLQVSVFSMHENGITFQTNTVYVRVYTIQYVYWLLENVKILVAFFLRS